MAHLGRWSRLLKRHVDCSESVGPHRTILLQDVELGLDLEIYTIIGLIVELTDVCGEDIPCIETVYANIIMIQQVMHNEKAKVLLLPVEKCQWERRRTTSNAQKVSIPSEGSSPTKRSNRNQIGTRKLYGSGYLKLKWPRRWPSSRM